MTVVYNFWLPTPVLKLHPHHYHLSKQATEENKIKQSVLWTHCHILWTGEKRKARICCYTGKWKRKEDRGKTRGKMWDQHVEEPLLGITGNMWEIWQWTYMAINVTWYRCNVCMVCCLLQKDLCDVWRVHGTYGILPTTEKACVGFSAHIKINILMLQG